MLSAMASPLALESTLRHESTNLSLDSEGQTSGATEIDCRQAASCVVSFSLKG